MTDISPDVTQYVNLVPFDLDPTTLYTEAVAAAQLLLPEWTPIENNTEVVLMESLAVIVSELVYAANRLPGATVSTLLALYNIVQGVGAPATATATVTFVDASGYDLPAGTPLALTLNGVSYTFTTNVDTPAVVGTQTVTVAVTCSTNAAAPNGTAVGTALIDTNQDYFVDTAALASSPTGGEDPETNTAWLNRAASTLQGISTTLVVPDQFTTAALNTTGVFRAFTVDQWNPAANGGAGGTAGGYVTVAVIGQGGSLVSDDTQTALQTALEAECVAGLSVSVVDPNVTTVDVTATVWQESGYTVEQVQENVAASLAASIATGGAGLSTDQWPWGSTVILNNLITVITQTAGVAFVVDMVAPADNVALSGAAPLATLGTVTITVQGP